MLKAKREKANMRAATIYLDDLTREALQLKSDETGAPIAELIRRSIAVYLQMGGTSQYAELQKQMREQKKSGKKS
jgi:hypothetical protein